MNLPEIKPGDIFCSAFGGVLGKAITIIEALKAKDGEAEYSHSGIFISPSETFESLDRVISRKWPEEFIGAKVLVGRHERMDQEAFDYAWGMTRRHWGEHYPYHRLAMHAAPWLAKISLLDWHVCSELALEHWWYAGLIIDWRGKNPDDVADLIHKGPPCSIVWEGIVNGLAKI